MSATQIMAFRIPVHAFLSEEQETSRRQIFILYLVEIPLCMWSFHIIQLAHYAVLSLICSRRWTPGFLHPIVVYFYFSVLENYSSKGYVMTFHLWFCVGIKTNREREMAANLECSQIEESSRLSGADGLFSQTLNYAELWDAGGERSVWTPRVQPKQQAVHWGALWSLSGGCVTMTEGSPGHCL